MQFNIPAEHKNASGVYIIRNTVNSKVYVGSAIKLKRRYTVHVSGLNRCTHHSVYLQRFVKKYGIENLTFSLLEITSPIKEALLECEQKWLDYYQAFMKERGYNTCPVAGSSLGVKASPETCAKLSAIGKGRGLSVEHRQKLAEAARERAPDVRAKNTGFKGCKHTDERKAALSETAKNRSPELRAKMAAAIKASVTPEMRAEISARAKRPENLNRLATLAKGRTHSEETKAKMSARLKARMTPEYIVELSAKIKGKTRSEEAKARIAAGAKRRWAAYHAQKAPPGGAGSDSFA